MARHGPARQIEIAGATCRKTILRANHTNLHAIVADAPNGLQFDLRRILRRRHHRAGDVTHVLARAGELAAQEVRLDAHGLLQVGGMNQFPRMLERVSPDLAMIRMPIEVFAWGCAIAVLLALVSGLPPALRARRLQLVDALAGR